MNSDLISRSDIKDHISELMLVYSGTELNNAILNAIDNAPTVDTTFREVVAYECGQKSVEERPKGKWIEYDDDGLYAGECSCCKWKAVLYESNVLNMNFCPNCGARMERVI